MHLVVHLVHFNTVKLKACQQISGLALLSCYDF